MTIDDLLKPPEPADRIAALRAIADGQSDNLEDVDAFEAARMLRVFDALTSYKREEFAALSLDRMRAVTNRIGTLVPEERRTA